ncbi:MAG: alkaline ceramidase [Bacteriovoracaceae bacterium]|nr:alkaline ceramidase [Bacteriovoracaceae bacterium]
MNFRSKFLESLVLLLILSVPISASAQIQVGIAKSDITGPFYQNRFLGFGQSSQKGQGIHGRVYAKAFTLKNGQNIVSIVNLDLGMVSQILKIEVVKSLQKRAAGIFDHKNVLLTATHTHSALGGFFHFKLYKLAAGGYSPEYLHYLVNQITNAIISSYKKMVPAKVLFKQGLLDGVSFNQSLVPYQNNPDWKSFPRNYNNIMSLLRFEDLKKRPLGSLNWFSVHPTTLGKHNKLISGDNKGVASALFEQKMKDRNHPSFIAAFANSDEGDISSDIFTAHQKRVFSELERVQEIGKRQYKKAIELHDSAITELTNEISSIHTWIKMPSLVVKNQYTSRGDQSLCSPALGHSFVAGSEDGPSEVPGFYEGITAELASKLPFPLKGLIRLLSPILKPSKLLKKCHFPKPILISTGDDVRKNGWTPTTLPFQIIRIGQLALASIPGEMTTMAGRRLRELLKAKLAPIGVKYVVNAGLSNAYSGYITTYEEYQKQHYEGASTHFGPFTLSSYLQIFDQLATSLINGVKIQSRPTPKLAAALRGNIRVKKLVLTEDSPNTWLVWTKKDLLSCFNCTDLTVTIDGLPPGSYQIKHDGFLNSGLLGSQIRRFTGPYYSFHVRP